MIEAMNDNERNDTMNRSITEQVNALTGLALEAMKRKDWDTVAAIRAQVAAIANELEAED